MTKWVTKQTASWLERHFSDTYERIVPTKKGVPLGVAPKGMFRVGLFTDYDELSLVDLRPKNLSLDFKDGLSTKDGVKVNGKLEISAKPTDNSTTLLRLVPNSEQEEKLLLSSVKQALKIQLSSKDWIDLSIINPDDYSNTKVNILDFVNKADLCFTLIDIIEISFEPVDKELAALLEQKRKEIEKEKLQVAKIKGAEERIKLETQIEDAKLLKEKERQLAQQKHQNILDDENHAKHLERKRNENKDDLDKKKNEINLENETFKERVKLLKENPEALAILNPDAYIKIKLAELQNDAKYQEFLKQLAFKQHDNKLSYNQGQFSAVKAYLENQHGFKFTEGTSSSIIEDEVKKIKDQSSDPKKEEDNSSSEKPDEPLENQE